MTVLTSPTKSNLKQKQLYYFGNDWETQGDSYGLEVQTERKEDDDLNNGRCFRERIRVQDSETTLVGGEWGDQFHVAYIHSKKRTTCSGLMKTALNNVVLPTLFKVVNNTEQVDEPELACNQV